MVIVFVGLWCPCLSCVALKDYNSHNIVSPKATNKVAEERLPLGSDPLILDTIPLQSASQIKGSFIEIGSAEIL